MLCEVDLGPSRRAAAAAAGRGPNLHRPGAPERSEPRGDDGSTAARGRENTLQTVCVPGERNSSCGENTHLCAVSYLPLASACCSLVAALPLRWGGEEEEGARRREQHGGERRGECRLTY